MIGTRQRFCRLCDVPADDKDRDGKYRQRLPRCHGEVAMADAIIALAANLAMKNRGRIESKPEWVDADKPGVPETAA